MKIRTALSSTRNRLVVGGLLVGVAVLAAGVWTDWLTTDFAQRVYVSMLSTLGSLGVAVFLYYLNRQHQKAKEEQENQRKLIIELWDLLKTQRDAVRTDLESFAGNKAKLTLSLYTARLVDYEVIILDEHVRELTREIRRLSNEWITSRDLGDVESSAEFVKWLTFVHLNASVDLGRYIANGRRMDVSALESDTNAALAEMRNKAKVVIDVESETESIITNADSQ